MSNVINIAAFKNDRRATTEQAARDTAKAARYDKLKQETADALGGTLGAQIIAETFVDLKRDKDAHRPSPAYCDPHNEKRGAKFEATQKLRLTDIAARMRQDVKDAIAAGTLPKGLKVSIVVRHHTAIDLRVTALPDGFKLFSDSFAHLMLDHPDDWYNQPRDRDNEHTAEYQALMAAIRAIHWAYNRDNSDSQSDYFDVRYYGDAAIGHDLKRACEAREVAAIRAKTAVSLPRFKVADPKPSDFRTRAAIHEGLYGKDLIADLRDTLAGGFLINRAFTK